MLIEIGAGSPKRANRIAYVWMYVGLELIAVVGNVYGSDEMADFIYAADFTAMRATEVDKSQMRRSVAYHRSDRPSHQ